MKGTTPEDPGFKLGTQVRLVADPNSRGVILQKNPLSDGRMDYLVFFNSKKQGWYSETAIEEAVKGGGEEWLELRSVTHLQFLKDLALTKLNSQLTDTLYSYQASRTHIEPYQFKPALKFLESRNQRVLLADEVGLGKTIEAGIIYLELKARLNLRRVLVVCPSGLRYKWRGELYNRFDEDFQVIDSREFRHFLDMYSESGGNARLKAIVSLESIRQEGIGERMKEVGLELDLTIVDEAHHLRNPSTYSHQVGIDLSDVSDAMLLLTATPIQLGNQDLFSLLYILDEGEFTSYPEFEQLLEPNTHINRACVLLSPKPGSCEPALAELRKVEQGIQRERYLQNPLYQQVLKELAAPNNWGYDRLVRVQRSLRELSTLAHVLNRTTKKDVAPGAHRSAHIIGITLTPEEREFYEAVLEYVRSQYKSMAPSYSAPPPFAVTQRERQAASCIAAAKEYLEKLLDTGLADLEAEDSTPELTDSEDPGVNLRDKAVQKVRAACKRLGDTDTKLGHFLDALDSVHRETPDSKVLVFSFFKRTLNYLFRNLKANPAYIDRVWLIHGDVDPQQRRRIIEEFRIKPGFGILLTSEVGAEGLDFQFCDVLMNYDLPWNPMRVEQRIGRVDRYGQEHERIRIFSFVLNDTIEERILQRLYMRIRIFEESIGDLEPILGGEIAQLEREIFQSTLSPKEEAEKTEAVLKSIEFKRQQAEEFRKEQKRLMGQDIILNQQIDDILNSGRYLSPQELRALVECYLKDAFPNSRLIQNKHDTEDTYVLKCCGDLCKHISLHISKNRHKYSASVVQGFENKKEDLKGIPLTFSGDIAVRRPLLEFLNFRHPVVDAAREHFHVVQPSTPLSHLGCVAASAPPELQGEYAFFIYSLTSTSADRMSTLQPVVLDRDGMRRADVEAQLMSALQRSDDIATESWSEWDWDGLQRSAHEAFAELRDVLEKDLQERNNALIDSRIAGLQQTYGAKIRRVEQQLAAATDERIQRMRQGQIGRLRTELDAKVADWNAKRAVAVGGMPVLAGYISLPPADSQATVLKRPSTRHDEKLDALDGVIVEKDTASSHDLAEPSTQARQDTVGTADEKHKVSESQATYKPSSRMVNRRSTRAVRKPPRRQGQRTSRSARHVRRTPEQVQPAEHAVASRDTQSTDLTTKRPPQPIVTEAQSIKEERSIASQSQTQAKSGGLGSVLKRLWGRLSGKA